MLLRTIGLCGFFLSSIACAPKELSLAPYTCPNPALAQAPNLESIQQASGYLNVPSKGKLFYWLVRSENDLNAKSPLVIWLNGGPGGSSLLGMFYRSGPYLLNPDLSIYKNPDRWSRNMNVLYIDQPLGVGFSLVDGVQEASRNENDVADAMNAALEDFYAKHPELAERDVYLMGESFAGTYIPWIATKILEKNAGRKTPMNLKGIAIGDGTVDRLTTWKYAGQYAFNQGLITARDLEYVTRSLLPACVNQIEEMKASGLLGDPSKCIAIDNFHLSKALNINIYDVRVFREYDFRPLACYLNAPQVQSAIGVNKVWKDVNDDVFTALYNDGDRSTIGKIQALLEAKIRVVIYNGKEDLLINYLGTQAWVTDLANGKYGSVEEGSAFLAAPENKWLIDGRLAGSVKQAGNLSLLLVNDAGHMVGMDQPESMYRLLTQFVLAAEETDRND